MDATTSPTDVLASVTAARRSLDRGDLAAGLTHLDRAVGHLHGMDHGNADAVTFHAFASLDDRVADAHAAVERADSGANRRLRLALRQVDELVQSLGPGSPPGTPV